MNTEEFRRRDDIDDRRDQSTAGFLAGAFVDGARKIGDSAAKNYRRITGQSTSDDQSESGLSDALGAKDMPKGYAEGGLVLDDDNEANQDETTTAVSKALQTVNDVLMYGRQKNGLPTSQQSDQDGDQQGAIPDSDDDSDDQGSDQSEPSFAEGGEVSDDLDNEGSSNDGAIPDGDDSGAAPVISQSGSYEPSSDESGVPAIPTEAGAVMQPDYSNPPDGSVPPQREESDYRNPPPGNPIQKIMNYLTGGDAMSPEQFDQYMAKTRSQASTPSENTLLAAQAATDEGGPDAGFGFVQAARKLYDKSANLGRAAAEQGDTQGAVTAANKAFAHVPDQYDATFEQTKDGAAATIKDMTTGKSQKQQMTTQQLGQLLDTRGIGQWDHLMERGVPAAIKYIPQASGTGTATIGTPPAKGQAPSFPGQEPESPASRQRAEDEKNAPPGYPMLPQQLQYRTGPIVSGRAPEKGYYGDDGQYHKTQNPRNGSFRQDVGDNVNAKVNVLGFGNNGNRVYGFGGQDLTPDRQQENRLELIREKNKGLVDRTSAANEGRQAIEKMRGETSRANTTDRVNAQTRGQDIRSSDRKATLETQKAHYDQIAARVFSAEAMKNYRARLQGGADPKAAFTEEVERMQPQNPGVQAQSPSGMQAPQRPSGVPDGAKFYNGKWYTRGQNGEAIPVQ